MANIDRPRGLVPVGHLQGGPWNGKFNIYYVAADLDEAMYVGDAVTLAGSADDTGKYPTIQLATAGTGNDILGAIVGFGDNPQLMTIVSNLSTRYKAALTAMYVAVVDDPYTIFEIQEVSGGTALAKTAVGNNAPIVLGSGDTSTGLSGHEVNNAGEVNTTEQLRLLRVAPYEDNDLGEHCKWWVLINEHSFKEAAGV